MSYGLNDAGKSVCSIVKPFVFVRTVTPFMIIITWLVSFLRLPKMSEMAVVSFTSILSFFALTFFSVVMDPTSHHPWVMD